MAFEVRNEEIEQLLRGLAFRIGQKMPDHFGFTLLIFEYGANGALYYISSANRDDMVLTMKEFIAKNDPTSQIVEAARNADWQQVVLNGGPPCFHLENGRFCLRAERWEGHEPKYYGEHSCCGGGHRFIPLAELVAGVKK